MSKKQNATPNPVSTLDNAIEVQVGSDIWTPRNGARFGDKLEMVNSKLERLRRRVTKPKTTTTAAAVPTGTPLQLKSVAAYQTAYKSQTKTYSLVSISFQQQTDPNFAGVRIWFKGYEGSTNAQLMSDGPTSPVTFLAEATQETVTVIVQPYGPNGQVAALSGALRVSLKLSGVVSAPPAPTVTQNLAAVPGGFQFTFALEGGLLADVVQSYKVYRNTLNNSGAATVCQTITHPSTNNGTFVFQDYPGGDSIYFYWVSAVNTTGLESSLTAAQSSTNQALATANGLGHNFVPNPGFETNTLGLLGVGVTTASYPICDGWQVQNSTSGLFTLMNENGNGRNGTKCLRERLNQSVTVPTGTSFCRADGTIKMPIQSGDWVGWRVYYNAQRNATPPAGVALTLQVGVGMWDINGNNLGFLLSTVTPTYDVNYHQIAAIKQMNTANCAYITPFLQQFVNNTSGVTQATTTHLWSDVRYDDCFFYIQALTNDSTPQQAAYTANSQPLTATISGTVATIHIAAYTVTYPFGNVSYSSSSVSGLAGSTKYYIIGSDRGFAGGALTYQATTSNPTVNSSEEFIYLGYVTTPASGGGGTTGGFGGGGGSCFTGNTILKGGKSIMEIQAGDLVTVEKDDGTQLQRKVGKVLIHDHSGPLYHMGNEELVTPQHQFRKGKEWCPAKFLFYDQIYFVGKVYNLEIETEVEDEHNYVLANGMVAHNLQKF